jgi:chromosome segregation ATPase
MQLEKPNGRGVYAEPIVEEHGGMTLDSLKILETRVEDVLGRHSALVSDRDRLAAQLREAEARVAELSARIESFEKERAQVRARVESILGRLEGLDLT